MSVFLGSWTKTEAAMITAVRAAMNQGLPYIFAKMS